MWNLIKRTQSNTDKRWGEGEGIGQKWSKSSYFQL